MWGLVALGSVFFIPRIVCSPSEAALRPGWWSPSRRVVFRSDGGSGGSNGAGG